jgi:hypothetical protein
MGKNVFLLVKKVTTWWEISDGRVLRQGGGVEVSHIATFTHVASLQFRKMARRSAREARSRKTVSFRVTRATARKAMKIDNACMIIVKPKRSE